MVTRIIIIGCIIPVSCGKEVKMKQIILALLVIAGCVSATNSLNIVTDHYEFGQFCRSTPYIVDSSRAISFVLNLDEKYVIKKEAGDSNYYTIINYQQSQVNGSLRLAFDMMTNDKKLYHVYMFISAMHMFIIDPVLCTFEVITFDILQ